MQDSRVKIKSVPGKGKSVKGFLQLLLHLCQPVLPSLHSIFIGNDTLAECVNNKQSGLQNAVDVTTHPDKVVQTQTPFVTCQHCCVQAQKDKSC